MKIVACNYPLTALHVAAILLSGSLIGAMPLYADWTSIGPWGGNIEQVSISPTHPTWMACSVGSKLYLSDDAADHWRRADDAASSDDIIGLEREPWERDEFWVLAAFDGLFHSDDGGASWQRREPIFNPPAGHDLFHTCGFVIDPSVPGHLYAHNHFQLFESNDDGRSWSELAAPTDAVWGRLALVPEDPAQLIVIAPYNWISRDDSVSWERLPELVYPVQFCTAAPGPVIYFANLTHLYRLLPGAAAWETLTIPFNRITAIEASKTYPYPLIAATSNSGLFKSTDSGDSWTNVLDENTAFNAVAIRADRILAGGGRGIFGSTNGGVAFTRLNDGIDGLDILDMAFDPFAPATLYAVCEYALWKSEDSGSSWAEVASVPEIGSLTHILLDPYRERRIFLSSSNLLIVSDDGGATWELMMENLWGRYNEQPMCFDPGTRDCMLFALNPLPPPYGVATYHSNLFKRSVGDTTWERVTGDETKYIRLTIDSANSSHWLITEASLDEKRLLMVESLDAGVTWQNVLEIDESATTGFHSKSGAFRQVPSAASDYILAVNGSISSTWTPLPETFLMYDTGLNFLTRIDSSTKTVQRLELYPANDILILDEAGEDYLIAGTPVCRAGTRHLQATPLGSGLDQADKLLRDPLNPDRILAASRWSESIHEFMLTHGQPPASPTNIAVTVNGQHLTLSWELPGEAVGAKLYLGDESGIYPLRCIVPDRQTSYEIEYSYPIHDGHLHARLSSYDLNGRESEFTAEQTITVASNIPVILGAGFWTSAADNFSRDFTFVLWATDAQGPDSLDHVELRCDEIGFVGELRDDGSDSRDIPGDGVFIATVNSFAFYTASGPFQLTAVVYDKDGNQSQPWPQATVTER